jgi:hypothetical protein
MNCKFTYFTSPNALPETEAPHDYGERYMLEEYPTYSRLNIGASVQAINLLLKLSDCLSPPFYCLYVLLVGRSTSAEGRYQSPLLQDRKELVNFLLDHKELFESDGRHHIWLSAPEEGATLVYDKHNIIYAYGPLPRYESILQQAGYRRENFALPFPHGHYY